MGAIIINLLLGFFSLIALISIWMPDIMVPAASNVAARVIQAPREKKAFLLECDKSLNGSLPLAAPQRFDDLSDTEIVELRRRRIQENCGAEAAARYKPGPNALGIFKSSRWFYGMQGLFLSGEGGLGSRVGAAENASSVLNPLLLIHSGIFPEIEVPNIQAFLPGFERSRLPADSLPFLARISDVQWDAKNGIARATYEVSEYLQRMRSWRTDGRPTHALAYPSSLNACDLGYQTIEIDMSASENVSFLRGSPHQKPTACRMDDMHPYAFYPHEVFSTPGWENFGTEDLLRIDALPARITFQLKGESASSGQVSLRWEQIFK